MNLAATILALLAAGAALAQQTKPGDLVPVEQGTVDTSATQTTLRVLPVELSESTNFLRLYGVAGRPDLLVRSHGGTYAVFDQGQYVTWKGRSLPVWPSGTQFFIGRPDFSRVHSAGIRMGAGSNMLSAPGIDVTQRKEDLRVPDARVVDPRPPVPGDARLPDQRVPEQRIENRVGARPAPTKAKAARATPKEPPSEPADAPMNEPQGGKSEAHDPAAPQPEPPAPEPAAEPPPAHAP